MEKKILIILYMVCLLPCLAFSQSDRQLIRQGNKQFRNGQYEQAESEYRKALAANPRNPEALYNLGCALMSQQKDSVAVQCFENSAKVQTDPLRKSQAFHNIGVICQQKKLFKEAIEAYKESLRNNPKDDETRYNLALCMKQLKNQPQQQNGDGKDKKDEKKKQQDDKKQHEQQKQKEKRQDQQQDKQETMSKENAEQLLNAAIQQEKATQERLKQQQQKPRQNRHQKNW